MKTIFDFLFRKKCEHEWEEPIMDQKSMRYSSRCKKCGAKITEDFP